MIVVLALCQVALGDGKPEQKVTFLKVQGHPTNFTDINDSGTIVGYYVDDSRLYHGFLRQNNGGITLFDLLDSTTEAGPMLINTAGTITGYYYGGAGYSGFVRDSLGQYTTFAVRGSQSTYPVAINSSGVIAGYYIDAERHRHSFVRSASGLITRFNVGSTSGATAINDDGTIVGYYADATTHGYIRNAVGEITTLDFPGSSFTYLSAINAKGEMAGASSSGNFIRDSAGKFTTVFFPVLSINQEGDVCGSMEGGGEAYPNLRYSDGTTALFHLPFEADGDSHASAINSSRTVVGTSDSLGGFISQPLSAIDFSTGFSEASEFVNLKGSAALNGSQLMLTNGKDSEASSAFYGYPVDIRSFTTDFTFQPSDAVADGLTFTIQNDDPSAVGFPGAGLGYQRIDKSVAIKFDFHNNFGEGSDSTGLYLNGASPTVPAVDLSHTGINLASGDPIKVHVVYDSASSSGNLTLTITDDFTMDTWSKPFTVDIPGAVGATTAYVGFTASTGEKTSTLALSSWTYEAGNATP